MSTKYDTTWRYWRACAVLLTYGLLWNPMGYCFAGILSLVHVGHYVWIEKSLTAFTVQVRVFYSALLIAAAPEPMRPLYLLCFLGTWAIVLYGYCVFARVMSLMPWNRRWRLSRERFWTAVSMPPRAGSAFDSVLGGAGCGAVAFSDEAEAHEGEYAA